MKTRAERIRVRVLAATLTLAFAGGCAFLRMMAGGGAGEAARPFSHARHVEDVGMGCTDCHATSENEALAGMPTLESCQSCHEELDEKLPTEKKVVSLYADESAWSRFTALPDDTIFSHSLHHKAGLKCAECHGNLEKNVSVTSRVRTSKDACMKCHSRTRASNECATCHKTIRRDTLPANHDHHWKRMHGAVARGGMVPPFDNRCSLCHTETSCASCHQDTPPANHTNTWRIRQHGFTAMADRAACATCHRTDFCTRCHLETSPRSHTAGWGSPRDRHCITCHTPLTGGGGGCAVCHKGTPSHQLAAPQPAWHLPTMNCRQCHGPGLAQPLPHPDKGDDCNACHS